VSTFDPSYNNTERNALVSNGYELATQGNGTLDSDWATCVGCAVLSRSLFRTETTVPDACTKCFDKYCWNGDIDESPLEQWVPALKLADEKIDVADSAAAGRLGGVAVAIVVALVMGVINLA